MKYVLDILIQKLPLNKDVTTNVTNVNVNKDVTLMISVFLHCTAKSLGDEAYG